MSTKTGDIQHFTSCPQVELSRICNEEKSVNSSLIPLVCNIIIIILQFNSNTQNLNHLPYAITTSAYCNNWRCWEGNDKQFLQQLFMEHMEWTKHYTVFGHLGCKNEQNTNIYAPMFKNDYGDERNPQNRRQHCLLLLLALCLDKY